MNPALCLHIHGIGGDQLKKGLRPLCTLIIFFPEGCFSQFLGNSAKLWFVNPELNRAVNVDTNRAYKSVKLFQHNPDYLIITVFTFMGIICIALLTKNIMCQFKNTCRKLDLITVATHCHLLTGSENYSCMIAKPTKLPTVTLWQDNRVMLLDQTKSVHSWTIVLEELSYVYETHPA